MSAEDKLIDAVLAAPNDDAPRLVYTDFLFERGDPRGELITVQCLVKRLEAENGKLLPVYGPAERRARGLKAELEQAETRLSVSYARGFWDYVHLRSFVELRALHDQIARHPVRILSFGFDLDLSQLRAIAEMPIASRLDEIIISRKGFQADDFTHTHRLLEDLVESPLSRILDLLGKFKMTTALAGVHAAGHREVKVVVASRNISSDLAFATSFVKCLPRWRSRWTSTSTVGRNAQRAARSARLRRRRARTRRAREGRRLQSAAEGDHTRCRWATRSTRRKAW